MPKINPIINDLKIHTGILKNKKLLNKFTSAPYALAATAAIGATGILVSSFFKDYKQTVEKDNYFQLKTNPATGKPYEADVFDGDNLIGKISFKVKGKAATINDDFDFGDDF